MGHYLQPNKNREVGGENMYGKEKDLTTPYAELTNI